MMFRVGVKISQDGDYAIYDVPARSSFSAVMIAMGMYVEQCNYPVLEIIVKRMADD